MFLQHTYIWKIFLLCLHIFFYDVTYAIRAIFQISFVDIVCNGIVLALLAIVTYDARDRLPLLLPKVLVTCAYHDVPYENLDSVAELISHCIKKPHPQKMQESKCTPEERSELVEMFEDFLNS